MTPERARRAVAEALSAAFERVTGIRRLVQVVEPHDASFGDLSTQIALEAAGGLGMNPGKLARELAESADLPADIVGRISVAGPGFLNMTFSDSYLDSYAFELGTDGLLGFLPRASGAGRALVEYVSSNPTGPLSVGHCRQAVLGEAIARLLEATGWKVEREYYFNDAGRQTALLGESLAARYFTLAGTPMPVPEGGYQGGYISEWAGDLLASRPGLSWPGDSEVFTSYARDRAMDLIVSDLSLLGIVFDRFFNESSLVPVAAAAALERLSSVNTGEGSLVYENPPGSGKMWLRLTALGRPEDRVVRRENGMFTYRMPDIAYHLDKFARGYDLLVDIFGSDHLDTSRDVTAALEALLGREEVSRRLKIVLHQFVTLLREGRKVKMSTRSANFVTLRELVEEVGSADVTRYLFLTRRAEAHMDFDLELAARQSDENPVYYVQYAHARICGILGTAAAGGIEPPAALSGFAGRLSDPAERKLIRLLELVPCRVISAADALEPQRITELLAEIATAFHSFYQKIRVVDPAERELSSARLLLCRACRNVIRDLLGILSVEAPERM